jgi:GNAT superfamily N-acetyltransferase
MSNQALDIEARVSHYWADYLGCTVADLDGEKTRVVRSSAVSGLVAFSKGRGWVVAVTEEWGQEVATALPPYFVHNQLPDIGGIRQVLAATGVTAFYGPATIFLQPAPRPLHAMPVAIRRLQPVDIPLLHLFRLEGGESVSTFGQGDGWLCAWGAFAERRLVSVCAVRVWGALLAEIYIDTLPAYRNRGYGKAVTNAAVQWVQANSPYVVESVVELSNESSLALMASMQFKPYGYMLLSEATNTTVSNCDDLP